MSANIVFIACRFAPRAFSPAVHARKGKAVIVVQGQSAVNRPTRKGQFEDRRGLSGHVAVPVLAAHVRHGDVHRRLGQGAVSDWGGGVSEARSDELE